MKHPYDAALGERVRVLEELGAGKVLVLGLSSRQKRCTSARDWQKNPPPRRR